MYQEFDIKKIHHIPIERCGINRYEKVITFSNNLPVFLKENASLEAAVYKIIQSHHRSIPIIANNNNHKLVGIISMSDVLNAFLRDTDFNEPMRTVMTRDVISVKDSDPVGPVIQEMKKSKKGTLPVVAKKRLLGVISEYDIAKYFAHAHLGIQTSEIMTRKPLFAPQDITILDAAKIIANSKYRRLPIVDAGRVIGIITASDIIKCLRNVGFHKEELLSPLNSIIKKELISVRKHKDISEAIRLMLVNGVSGILVVDNYKLEGIITQKDIINQLI